MLLHEQILQSLPGLTGLSAGTPKTVCWSVDHGPAVEIDFTVVDSLSCSFRELRVSAEEMKGVSSDSLKAWADQLCARVNYLLEPLRPIETDPEAQAVLVRSSPPRTEDSRISYYEMLVKSPGVVALRRYVAESTSACRNSADIAITNEVLVRLVRDIVDAVPALVLA